MNMSINPVLLPQWPESLDGELLALLHSLSKKIFNINPFPIVQWNQYFVCCIVQDPYA